MPGSLTEQLSAPAFAGAARIVSRHAHRTPLLGSRLLSDDTGFDVRLKAEVFQKTGSYKIRGPLNKLRTLNQDEQRRGVICSSAGNHAQGVALAARIYSVPVTVVMATNATPSKIRATEGYGARVVLEGSIWDEADAHARTLVERDGLAYIHPFDDIDLILGQGTVGWEIYGDWPEVEVAIVPIGGGGLISGISAALKSLNPSIRVIGVESSAAPAMQRSLAAGEIVNLDGTDCAIDGLKVLRVGDTTFRIVSEFVDQVVSLSDDQIFESMLWVWAHTKLLVEGAAAAPVAALRNGQIDAPAGTKIVCVLSGGNVDLRQLEGRTWN